MKKKGGVVPKESLVRVRIRPYKNSDPVKTTMLCADCSDSCGGGSEGCGGGGGEGCATCSDSCSGGQDCGGK